LSSERRKQRVARAIRDIISEGISELQDPRVKGLISITAVEMSPDTRYADVYLSCFGVSDMESQLTFKAIEHARGHLQTAVAHELNMRFCPMITLHHDVKQAKVSEMLKIFERISEESQGHNDGGDDSEE
jgi:ribosome-binding factor A